MQQTLVERARRGDRDAYTALAAAAIGRLDGTARLILRDPDTAKDAIQEALIRAWRQAPHPARPGMVRRLAAQSVGSAAWQHVARLTHLVRGAAGDGRHESSTNASR